MNNENEEIHFVILTMSRKDLRWNLLFLGVNGEEIFENQTNRIFSSINITIPQNEI